MRAWAPVSFIVGSTSWDRSWDLAVDLIADRKNPSPGRGAESARRDEAPGAT